jgi:hypothetical protein
MTVGLEIQAGLETVEVNKGLKQIADGVKDVSSELLATQNNLKNFENALKKATNSKEVEYLQRAVTGLKSKLEVLNSTQNNLLGTQNKFVAGSNQASQALTNLGRVAQDAPFGFIGIANNLNPLLESFQRLKVETGSTKGALQALGGSLMGAGGLGLALSLVTAAVSFAQMGFRAWGVENEEAKKKVDEHKKAVDSIYSSVSGEAVKVQTLIAVLQSETATRQKKLATLEELKKIQPEIFNGLKLEGSAVVGLDAAYIKYLNSLKTVIAVKIKQQELEKVTEELLRKEGVTLDRLGKAVASISKARLEAAKIATGNLAKDEENAKTVIKLQAIENKNTKEKNKLQLEAKAIIQDIADLQKGVTVNEIKEPKTPKVKDVKDYKDIIAELRKDVRGVTAEFEKFFITQDEFDDKKISSYAKAIKELGEIKAPKAEIDDISFEILPTQISSAIKKGVKLTTQDTKIEAPVELQLKTKEVIYDQRELDERLSIFKKAVQLNIPIAAKFSLVPVAGSQDEDAKEQQKKANEYAAGLVEVYKSTVGNAFSGIGEAIAQSMQGGNLFEGLFNGILAAFGEGIVAIGKKMIIASSLLESINKAFGVGDFSKSLIGGIALVAFGSLLKGLKIGKNAQGTDYWRGGLTMVGERGPELISLPRGARVTPNHEMGGIGGSMAVDIQPITIFRGTELMVYFNKVSKLNNTVG